MNISIFASIWCQNLGDELILKNEIKILENAEFKAKKIDLININWQLSNPNSFRVFTYDIKNTFFQKDNVSYLEYFPIWIKNKKNIFRNIKNFISFVKTIFWSDLIVIWWGGIIYDNEVQANKNPLDQWIFRNKFFRFFRKKVVFYAVWINIKNKENLGKLKQIFSKAYKVYVRDSYSFKTLKDLWITSEIIDDPVFSENYGNMDIIKGRFPSSREWQNDEKSFLIKEIEASNFSLKDFNNVDLENKKIGITFRAGYIWKSGNEKIEILMIRELVELLLSKNCKVYFLPHSIHTTDIKSNDLEYYKKIISWTKLEDKVYIAEGLEEVYSFYKEKKIDLCFAMRLHSMILSQVYEIPFIAFSYSKKTEELVKKIRNKELINKLWD